MPFNFDQFREACRTLEGAQLETGARRKPFKVRVDGDKVYFTPESTGRERTANRRSTGEVLALLAESGDWSSRPYHDLDMNASYILAIVKRFQSGLG